MIEMRTTAYRLKYTSANPAVFGSVATYTADKQFKCAYRSITASENVRAGRNASNAGLRVFYFPKFVTFATGDRVRISGKDYDIIFPLVESSPSQMTYIDTKALQ